MVATGNCSKVIAVKYSIHFVMLADTSGRNDYYIPAPARVRNSKAPACFKPFNQLCPEVR